MSLKISNTKIIIKISAYVRHLPADSTFPDFIPKKSEVSFTLGFPKNYEHVKFEDLWLKIPKHLWGVKHSKKNELIDSWIDRVDESYKIEWENEYENV